MTKKPASAPATITPDTKIPISFVQADWQYILNALAMRPYGEVNLLIASIRQQFDEAEAKLVSR